MPSQVTQAATIGGQPRLTDRTFDVLDPATGTTFATVPDCGTAELDAAMAAAAEAFPQWRGDRGARQAALLAISEMLFAHAGELGRLVTHEQGKPLADAIAEVQGAGVWFKHAGRMAPLDSTIQDDRKGHAKIRHLPLGVVAGITPWNFPVFLAAWKIAPALLAGNTFVLKPSPYTPVASLRMIELAQQVMPPGVLNAVSGGDELGAAMTTHPIPRKLTFTGSGSAGREVGKAAGAGLKRATLELGGNDPAIVLDDAVAGDIVPELFWGAFTNSGQVCSAMKRVFVPARMFDEVVDGLVDLARSVRVGNGFDEGVQLGPVSNRPQFERIRGLVDDAVYRGARAIGGGPASDGPGFFYRPTVVTGVEDSMPIVAEEQFGPALPVLPYTGLDEAVRRANGTNFGLSASVWGSDGDRVRAVGEQLECGTVWLNSHLALAPNRPFGGAKDSGLGAENGTWGLESYTQLQLVYSPPAAS